MKHKFLILFTAFILFTSMYTNFKVVNAASYPELAAYWAPKIYHDVNANLNVRNDFIAKFNFDGDWVGNNNWDNMFNYPENAYVYYQVQETDTHYFIHYDFFHPRDDDYLDVGKHENDFEGIILAIRKDGSTYGSFHVMETLAHIDWFQYTNDSNISSGNDDIDGSVLFENSHPKIFIEAGGHGVRRYDGSSAPGGDGIVYNYTGTPQFPNATEGSYTNSYGYDLISIDEIWERRHDTGGAGHTFESFGRFDGDNYSDDSANAPWNWDDINDGPTFIGMSFSDPAYFIDEHLNGLGSFSHNYINNKYFSHKLIFNTITSKANRDPFNGKSDLFIRAFVDGTFYTDNRMWKYDNASIDSPKTVFWGHDDADSGSQYSTDFNTIFIARPHNTEVKIEIFDHDSASGHETMGYLTVTPSPGSTTTWTNAYTSSNEALVTASVYANID